MVVPVLMTSCQVSEKPNIGPLTSQAMMVKKASTKEVVLPQARVAAEEKRSKTDDFFYFFVFINLVFKVKIVLEKQQKNGRVLFSLPLLLFHGVIYVPGYYPANVLFYRDRPG